jgi:hypothetical protein
MVMIETVLQALLHVHEPRILVCAPSNAAADVIARRLARLLPALRARHHANATTTIGGGADEGSPHEVALATVATELGTSRHELLPDGTHDASTHDARFESAAGRPANVERGAHRAAGKRRALQPTMLRLNSQQRSVGEVRLTPRS